MLRRPLQQQQSYKNRAGNGNYVRSNTITPIQLNTAHVKILVRRGQHVNQGMLLVVGSTGLATGPHVCYRFGKMGGDALKLKLPGGEPMKSAIKLVF
jgi:murein DD-endopeptidase MepM/ murein hydrolase activator NlpD